MNKLTSTVDEAQFLNLFPVPVIQCHWPDSSALSKALRDVILSVQGGSEGVRITNVGGWHSGKDLQRWDEDCIQVLKSRILELINHATRELIEGTHPGDLEGWQIQAWANVNSCGDYNDSHCHGGLWSGIYYVDVDKETSLDTGGDGLTVFEARGIVIKKGDSSAGEFKIRPRPGLMVIFPASLWHRVEPYYARTERITIAFNLQNPSFEILDYLGRSPVPKYHGLKGWMWKYFPGVIIPARYCRNILKRAVRRKSRDDVKDQGSSWDRLS